MVLYHTPPQNLGGGVMTLEVEVVIRERKDCFGVLIGKKLSRTKFMVVIAKITVTR